MRPPAILLVLALALSLLSGCGGPDFTAAEKATIASLSLAALKPLPSDASNRYADVPAAAALGATLFFDQGLSKDGTISCATCHRIDRQFQDDIPLGKAIGTTNRRTMPLAGVAHNAWFFWDGRRDSLWSQALVPLENPVEHGGNRAAYARYIAARYGERYERIFGPLPEVVTHISGDASPLGNADEQQAWGLMNDEQRDGIDQVFANIGKALAAFQRSLTHAENRFDRFAAAVAANRQPEGDAAFSEEETQGLKLFIGKANCSTCHTGPRFTDDHFHNTGVPPVANLPEDRGRVSVIAEIEDDPFNCLGSYSDAEMEACGELRFMVRDSPELVRAFKTPSLRGAAGRPPYMHAGQIGTLEDVVAHYATAPLAVEGESEVHPMQLSERERASLVAFLRTLGE